jgi:hypothetical protein
MMRRMLMVGVLAVAPLIGMSVAPAFQSTVASATPAVHTACGGGGMSQGSDTHC